MRQLPDEFALSVLRWQAVEGGLAYIQTRSPEDEWGREAAIAFRDLVWVCLRRVSHSALGLLLTHMKSLFLQGKTMLATIEYRDQGVPYLLLAPSDNAAVLVNSELCKLGLAKMPRRIPRFANEVGRLIFSFGSVTINPFFRKSLSGSKRTRRMLTGTMYVL